MIRFLRLFGLVFCALFAAGAALAQTSPAPANYAQPDAQGWRHALSLMGEVKYPPDFSHFDYVKPDAPKGGLLRLATPAAFDTFNIILPKGVPAPGLAALVYQRLTDASLDEIATQY